MKNKKNPNSKKMSVTDNGSNTRTSAKITETTVGKTVQPSNDQNAAAGKPYFEVADSVRNNSCDKDGYVLTDAQKRLLEVQGVAIDLLLRAHNSMIELAAVRLECKLSNTRVSGVAKELKELIKVMSVYDC